MLGNSVPRTAMPRIVLVSNRLPMSVVVGDERVEARMSSGGLASGLRTLHAEGRSVWVGWPGLAPRSSGERERIDRALAEEAVVPVHFSSEEMERYYEGVSNGVIWPLFHYLLDRVPPTIRYWEDYVSANERFADKVAEVATEDDLIWIHDYHLLLLPALLRKRLPRARIGFFLHIPFPSSEIFRVLPNRESVLGGLLGADLLGFHTFGDQRHFAASLLSVLGLDADVDHVDVEGRSVQLRVFPMGIDVDAFGAVAREPSVLSAALELRAAHGAEKLLLGVDRLDYTKGLPRKFLAVERIFERNAGLRGKIRLVQVAVPSRENVGAYRELKREIEEIAGRINGAYGTLHSAPIHYVYDSVSQAELVSSYRAADVMVVTPLRDGMNLVAKEYVASRVDEDGVLVLSEFAGAAGELAESLIVNPYDLESMALGIERALSMEPAERRARMLALRAKVAARPVELWTRTFLETLGGAAPATVPEELGAHDDSLLDLAAELATRPEALLLLDYDGTLVGIRSEPEEARPDAALRTLLSGLASADGVQVAVVSGRTRDSLERFVGDLPLALVAEHGVWTREVGHDWLCHVKSDVVPWREPVLAMLREYVARTPGARVEEKTAGLAWHYRNSDRHLGAARARELRLNLVQLLAQHAVTVLAGRKVVEVRPQEVDKGSAVRALIQAKSADALILAMGDDRTDEDLFRALPASGYSFSAGSSPTRARFRVQGPEQVRAFLRRFLEARHDGGKGADLNQGAL